MVHCKPYQYKSLELHPGSRRNPCCLIIHSRVMESPSNSFGKPKGFKSNWLEWDSCLCPETWLALASKDSSKLSLLVFFFLHGMRLAESFFPVQGLNLGLEIKALNLNTGPLKIPQIVLRENFGLPLNAKSTQVVFDLCTLTGWTEISLF